MSKVNKILLFVSIILFTGSILVGCAAKPTKPSDPEIKGVVFMESAETVQIAAVDALVVTGFEINKSEPLYVEGYRPRKVGLAVGSGGETVGIWLDKLEPSKTLVLIDTAKSLVGIVGQKTWDEIILEEMEKGLGKRQ
jgi:hypothetical protein